MSPVKTFAIPSDDWKPAAYMVPTRCSSPIRPGSIRGLPRKISTNDEAISYKLTRVVSKKDKDEELPFELNRLSYSSRFKALDNTIDGLYLLLNSILTGMTKISSC